MAYTSSTTILPHAGLYDYDGKQRELFHMQWFNCGYITGPRLMLCEMPEIGTNFPMDSQTSKL